MTYYASSVSYPNGEIITFAYDTVTVPGPPFQQTYYRPNRVTSSLGYFIAITYHSADLASGYWGSPAQATLYKSTAPTTPLGRLSYSLDGSTITDLGGRVFVPGCANTLSAPLERYSGSLKLPEESSPTYEAAALPGYTLGRLDHAGRRALELRLHEPAIRQPGQRLSLQSGHRDRPGRLQHFLRHRDPGSSQRHHADLRFDRTVHRRRVR